MAEILQDKDALYRQIIQNGDTERLLALSDEEKQGLLLELMYGFLCEMELREMNLVQRTLFLAMRLEDTCQMDGLPSLSEQEEVFLALPEMKAALIELGALKTAELLGEFIALLPEGVVPEWEWFFSGEQEAVISRIDGEITDYPDGAMVPFYLNYIADREIAAELLRFS